MKHTDRLRISISLLVCGALLGGCLHFGPAAETEPRQALSRWLYRTQGYVPVFPPREDVRIGDVHLYLSDPDAGGLITLYSMPRWSALPVTALLADSVRERPENPETPADYLRTGIPSDEREWPEAVGLLNTDQPATPTGRLRSIQLPPFAIERSDAAELPPALAMMLAVDDSQEDWSSARIGVEAAEIDALALEDAIGAFLERRGAKLYLPASLRQNLRALASRELETVWIRIVTEVVYMRALRLTIVTDPVALDLWPDEASSAALGQEDEESYSKADYVELDETYEAVARAHAMNERLIASGVDALPDGFFRFLRVSDELTTARRVFRRATAIGVGGLSLRVDARTGEVESFRLMGRDLRVMQGASNGEGPAAIDAQPRPPLDEAAAAGASDRSPADGSDSGAGPAPESASTPELESMSERDQGSTGVYQIGEDQARFWIEAGTLSGSGSPFFAASRVDHRV